MVVKSGLVLLVALLVCGSILVLLLRSRLHLAFQDKPSARSLHNKAVPRIGGLGIWAGCILALIAFASTTSPVVILGFSLVFAVSMLDDWRSQPALLRLAVHFGGAACAAYWLFPVDAALALISVLTIAAASNFYNFMDGADGLAGAMALVGFSALGLAALPSHEIAVIAFAIAGSCTAFLCFNLPPARVFMGDSGSVPLGFAAAFLGTWGIRDALWGWWYPVLVFLPFLVDTIGTLAFRLLRRKRVWIAHREHLYQQLVLSGWSHRRLLLASFCVMLMCSAAAHALAYAPSAWRGAGGLFILLAVAIAYGALRACKFPVHS